MSWDNLSRLSDVLGILSFIGTIGIFCIIKTIREKIKIFRVIEKQVSELKQILSSLSNTKNRSLIPKNVRNELRSVFLQIKNYHIKNKKVVEILDRHLNTLETDPNCSKGAMRIAVSEVIANIEISSEYEYASK